MSDIVMEEYKKVFNKPKVLLHNIALHLFEQESLKRSPSAARANLSSLTLAPHILIIDFCSSLLQGSHSTPRSPALQ